MLNVLIENEDLYNNSYQLFDQFYYIRNTWMFNLLRENRHRMGPIPEQ